MKVETLRHHQAFDIYYWLGENRNLSSVARQFKVSVPAVRKWSLSFNWQSRVKERDERLAGLLSKKSDAAFMAMKERQLRIVRKTQEKYEARLDPKQAAENGLSVYEPNGIDAVRSMQHEALIEGRPTSRTDVTVSGETADALVAAIQAVLRRPRHCRACGILQDLGEEIGREILALSQRAGETQAAAKVAAEAVPAGVAGAPHE